MKGKVFCIGASLVDEIFRCKSTVRTGTSNPAVSQRMVGGVMCNVARHLALMKIPVELVTVIGNDPDGERIKNELARCGTGTSHVLQSKEPTGKYAAILDNDGSLFCAASSDVSAQYLTPELFGRLSVELAGAAAVIADTNISEGALEWLSFFCRNKQVPFFVEPVSVEKAGKLARIDLSGVFMVTPNEDELPALCKDASADASKCAEELMKRGVRHVWLRKGPEGSEVITRGGSSYLAAMPIEVVDSTGAGDAALAGWVAGWYIGLDPLICQQLGHSLAFEVLQHPGAILPSADLPAILSKYYPDAQ